jgi:phosphoglucosamine mutase
MSGDVSPSLFGTDGIRGKVGISPLTPDFFFKFGQTLGEFVQGQAETSCLSTGPPILIAEDSRDSGPMISSLVSGGLLSRGLDVMHIGVCPTPVLAYMTRHQSARLGLMISASHNPPSDNGIKFFDRAGRKLTRNVEQDIEHLFQQTESWEKPKRWGQYHASSDMQKVYRSFLQRTFKDLNLSGWRIVLDCAHGATSILAPEMLASWGADVINIASSPQGQNINAGVGAAHPEVLSSAMKIHKADIGIAFDGDGDRVMLATPQGHLINGDQILGFLAPSLKNQGILSDHRIVTTTMANGALVDYLKNHKIEVRHTDVGDRHVKACMDKEGLTLGGESSGHVILGHLSTTGDGLLCALMVLDVLQKMGKSPKQVFPCFTPYPLRIYNIPWESQSPSQTQRMIEAFEKHIRPLLSSQGRLVVRPSGTEPLLRIMVEDPCAEIVAHVIKETDKFFTHHFTQH